MSQRRARAQAHRNKTDIGTPLLSRACASTGGHEIAFGLVKRGLTARHIGLGRIECILAKRR
jgi:hypothetical protein